MTASQVAAWVADSADQPDTAPLLLDVREQWEFDTARIASATLVPMSGIGMRIDEVRDLAESGDGTLRPIVCICHHGARSMQVANFLLQQGFARVVNMTGGIHSWSQQVDPSVPVY